MSASAASHLECSMKRYNRIKARSPLPFRYYLSLVFPFLDMLPLLSPAKASSSLSTLHKMTGQELYGPMLSCIFPAFPAVRRLEHGDLIPRIPTGVPNVGRVLELSLDLSDYPVPLRWHDRHPSPMITRRRKKRENILPKTGRTSLLVRPSLAVFPVIAREGVVSAFRLNQANADSIKPLLSLEPLNF